MSSGKLRVRLHVYQKATGRNEYGEKDETLTHIRSCYAGHVDNTVRSVDVAAGDGMESITVFKVRYHHAFDKNHVVKIANGTELYEIREIENIDYRNAWMNLTLQLVE